MRSFTLLLLVAAVTIVSSSDVEDFGSPDTLSLDDVGESAVKDCPAGYACNICAAGKYSDSTSDDKSCSDCAAGKYSTSGAASCSNCAAGKYSTSGATSCSGCAAGKSFIAKTSYTSCESEHITFPPRVGCLRLLYATLIFFLFA